MRSALAALLAGLIGYLVNRWAVRTWGPRVILFGVPVIEELAKTGSALLTGGAILPTHVGFGVIEACYDWEDGRHNVRAAAAIVGLIGHTLSGWLTEWMTAWGGHLIYGLLTATAVHILWNTAVLGHWLKR